MVVEVNIGLAEMDLIVAAVEELNSSAPELAQDLVSMIVEPFWDNMEPLPPVYDGPYGPDNPAPGNFGPEVAA